MSLLDQLNPRQREAVEAVEGPVLILAGAGSGKTRVITYRIVHLIEDLGVAPDSILAVTFTNKAAAEMGERVDRLLGGRSVRKPLISTFHSFCVRVLRRDIEALRIGDSGHKKDFAIYDEADQQSVVKDVMRRLGIDHKQLKPSAVLARISWAKNHMLDPQEMYLQSADPITEKIAHIFEAYRKSCARPTRSTSMTCCWRPSACSSLRPKCASVTSAASSTCSSTNTRTPTGPNTSSSSCWPGRATTSAWWGTRTSPYTPGAAPTSATSWSSSAISLRPGSFAWSRTTVPPALSWRRRPR